MTPAESRHLVDDRLIDLFFSAPLPEDAGDADWQHLDGCSACEARYERLAAFLSGVADQALLDADEVFSAARLENQRAHILHRLEAAGHPARVIPFPVAPAHSMRARLSTRARRWVVAAAVAGLVVGVTAGRLMLPDRQVNSGRMASARTVVPQAPVQIRVPSGNEGDEAFLARIDRALTGPDVEELRVLDEMTPRMRDASINVMNRYR